MHFLGVAGMPRRIPDYPDAFFILNKIATRGSYMSAFSLLVFFGVLFDAFVMNDNTQSFLEKKSGRILYVHSDHNTS
jgi:heme/copper-type cytochrome/quinol oxidase subunit 1